MTLKAGMRNKRLAGQMWPAEDFNQELILPNFILRKTKIFQFFAIKLGHFELETIFSCYKHSSLTTKIGKRKKSKFGRIDSWAAEPGIFFI
jgi:hypothetical protein